jgi:putative RNA 2'-phosphotransferase
MDRADVKRSKRLAAVLRHHPESIGIELDGHGWVGVERLLGALAAHGSPMTRQDLDRVVGSNDKQRFEWDLDADLIRARQGHSVDVDLGLVPALPPDVLYHGTPTRNVESILTTGLERRGRHHVHLSGDVATAHRVGARRGDHVVFEVDAARMARDGFAFYRSTNGVWLTDDVPPRYLAQRRPGP